MSRKIIALLAQSILIISLFSGRLTAQDFPEKPSPPRLVNDFDGMLRPEEANLLEMKLVAFNDSTSTQIAIVIVSDLKGYDKADYAQRLAEKWGIGQKGLNNGLLILIKTKTAMAQGQVSIAQGYGLEGAIPDLICSQIVDNEILPAFSAGDYFGGLDKATSTLMSLASGEFSTDQYGNSPKKGSENALSGIIMFVVILVIIVAIFSGKSGGSNKRNIGSKALPLWLLLSMMNSGKSSHSGSWGGFSGGGGTGSSGGGFGGFGGGSFGGGGAGGSW